MWFYKKSNKMTVGMSVNKEIVLEFQLKKDKLSQDTQ